jgi:F0F1-type ATP synthase assembly protein I
MSEPAVGPGPGDRESVPRRVARTAVAGVGAADFFGCLLAGFLLGFFADRWLGTGPALTIIGIVAGAGTGFWKLWQYASRSDEPRR